jgi:hypothetical protein
MMGVSLKAFSAWKAEYAELFDKLIGRFPEPKQPNNVTKTVGNRRIAYMSGSVGGEEVERELRECKIRYSVIENAAAIAGELLRSGSVLGNFQKPIYWKDFSSTSRPLLGGSQMGQAGESLFILVSAQLVNQEGARLNLGHPGARRRFRQSSAAKSTSRDGGRTWQAVAKSTRQSFGMLP